MRCDYYGHLYASSKFPLKINSLSSVSTDFSIYFSGGSVPFNSCVNIPNPLAGNLLFFCICSKCPFLGFLRGVFWTDVIMMSHLIQLYVARCPHCLKFRGNNGVLDPAYIWVFYSNHLRNFPTTVGGFESFIHHLSCLILF